MGPKVLKSGVNIEGGLAIGVDISSLWLDGGPSTGERTLFNQVRYYPIYLFLPYPGWIEILPGINTGIVHVVGDFRDAHHR